MRALQQEARELDQAPAQEIMKRLGLAHIARERVGQNSSAPPFWFGGDLRVVCVARPPGAWTLGRVAVAPCFT